MRRVHIPVVLLLVIVVAIAWAAWSSQSVRLTEEQKAWIARTEREIVESLPESNSEWKVVLSREQFSVLRKQGTERAFDNKYWSEKAQGLYRCAGCGQPVFWSTAKYDSGTGWPSFTEPAAENRVTITEERGWLSSGSEVSCGRCGGHLGHLFDDGPQPTNLRYCINSAALHLDETQRSDSPKEESTPKADDGSRKTNQESGP